MKGPSEGRGRKTVLPLRETAGKKRKNGGENTKKCGWAWMATYMGHTQNGKENSFGKQKLPDIEDKVLGRGNAANRAGQKKKGGKKK